MGQSFTFPQKTFKLEDGTVGKLTPRSVSVSFAAGDVAKLTKLLQGPMDPNSYCVVNSDTSKFAHDAPMNQSSWMHVVSSNGSLAMLKAFVENGGDVNFIFAGQSCLENAVTATAFENCFYLIEQGADVMHKDFFKRSLLKILDRVVEDNAKYADDEVMKTMLWDEGKVKLAADLRALLVSKGVTA
jgi:hypothetical protein